MLAIQVELLMGRYVATAYNDRQRSEWPPHPARLFSALTAAHFSAPMPPRDEVEALAWLEKQPPPDIAASPASGREVVTVFVPVNDTTVFPSAADGAWHASRALLQELAEKLEDADDTKTRRRLAREQKKAKRALDKLEEKHDKLIAAAKLGKNAHKVAQALLPERRGRQPRTFPSVSPEDPRVTFLWPTAEPPVATRQALDRLTARVTRLGHSSSLVSLRLIDDAPPANWHPQDTGHLRLRVAREGQLAALQEQFELHEETQPRVMPAYHQPYTDRAEREEPTHPRTVFGNEWLVLARTSGGHIGSRSAAGIASGIRRVLVKYAEQPVREIISGHRPDGPPSEAPHLAVLPLPFVGHKNADGRILGVALILPRNSAGEDARSVYVAVSRWEADAREGDEDAPELPLHLGRAGSLRLQRVEDHGSALVSLRPRIWCRASRRWLSVTPVALDRNPGDLRSRDIAKLSRAVQEAQESISLACERIGLPVPVRITILPNAPVAGSTKARFFPSFPPDAQRTKRVLTHAVLEFNVPVEGPVLLGAGRYVGLGLFRPEDADEW
jgi:CRISPR-associated protein Csb2